MLDDLDRKVREARVRHRRSDGFVYFLLCNGLVKIGYSDNPYRRIKEHATSSPFPQKLIGLLRGGKPRERDIHAHFALYRHSGEWFFLDPYVRSEINRMCGPDWKGLMPKRPKYGDRSITGPAGGLKLT